MLPILGIVAGVAGALIAQGINLFNVGTSLFGSAVAVTGDAHQCQVAQDIFRADVHHELSLLVREDMRDVYALMCETVATQVTMGSICLGVCFSVWIEGYASEAPPWIIELWAMFTAWATLFTLTSLLLAMWFQMSIKNAVRERLLLKHRIFTANDTVISSLGGRSLGEQVSRLHARLVAQCVHLVQVAVAGGCEAECRGGGQRDEEEGVRLHAICDGNVLDLDTGAGVGAVGEGGGGQLLRAGRASSSLGLSELSFQDLVGAVSPEDDLVPLVRATLCEACRLCRAGLPTALDGHHILRARRGLQGWFDAKDHKLATHKIIELPGFLAGGTLVRQAWECEGSRLRLEPLRLRVYDEATLYVTARVQEVNDGGPRARQAGAAGLSWVQALDLNRVCKEWTEDEMPRAVKGAHPECNWFQRVEGFSIFVDSHRIHLPLYKLVLQSPEHENRPVDVEVHWKFDGVVEALTVILREGCVLSSEDEYPKRAFMQEIEVLWPLMTFAAGYIKCGTSCLLLAVLWMHLSRLIHVRPWPLCRGEVSAMAAAAGVALFGIWKRMHVARNGRIFQLEEERRRRELGSAAVEDCGWRPLRLGQLWGRRADEQDGEDGSAAGAAAGRRGSIAKRLTGIVSSRLWHNSMKIRWRLALWSSVLVLAFAVSFVWCMDGVWRELRRRGPAPVPAPACWEEVPVAWPPLFVPVAAAFAPGTGALWATSGWQLAALDLGTGRASTPLRSPLRLATLTQGLCFVGGTLLAAGGDGMLRVLNTTGKGLHPDSSGLPALGSGSADLSGKAWGLPEDLGGLPLAFAASPEAGFWGPDAEPPPPVAGGGAGVLAVAVAAAGAPASAASGGIVLYALSELGVSRAPQLQALARLRPHLPSQRAAGLPGRAIGTPRAMHLCVAGACAAEEARLWIAHGDAGLLALGLLSGEVAEVQPPWHVRARCRIAALAGNSTHLVAISEPVASCAGLVRVARYAELLKGRSSIPEL